MSNRNNGERDTEQFSPIDNLNGPKTGTDKSDPWSINSIFGEQTEDVLSGADKSTLEGVDTSTDIYSGRPKETTERNVNLSSGYSSAASKSRKRKRKKMGRVKRTLLSLFLICIITVCLVAGAFGVYVFAFVDGSIPYDLNNLNLQYTSIVYAYDSDIEQYYEMSSFHGTENRIWVDAKDFSPYLENAIVSIEDKRFYDHEGVDWKRTFSAFLNMFFDFYGDKQGGSTITQQLVKNLTRDNEQTSDRKIREIVRARNLESKYTKSTIIECYINTVHFGNGCDGIETAAKYYFNKEAKDLTLLECASLAATIQTPNKINPIDGPEENKTRREICLKEMLGSEYITEAEYNQAMSETLVLASSAGDLPTDSDNPASKTKINNYFTDTVIENVISDLQKKYDYSYSEAENMIYSGGLKIYSTMNKQVQENLEESFKDDSLFPENGSGERPQSAQCIMDYTGHIVGIVGGRGEKTENRSLNRAYGTTRQPGSSIKPISVYAPGIENNLITYSSKLYDFHLQLSNNTYYPAKSGTGSYVTVQYAVQNSYNATAVRMADKLGVDTCFDFLTRRFGISTLVDSYEDENGGIHTDKTYSSMALGGTVNGISVTEMTAAFATFGNGGVYYKPTTYTVVYDTFGNVVLEQDEQGSQVISSDTSTIMNKILQTVVTGGTGTRAQIGDWPLFGKTGTTDNNHDFWFVGGSPYYVSGVWTGYDASKNVRDGYNPSPVIWKETMSKILKNKTLCDFRPSDSVSYRPYCTSTGLCATSSCGDTAMGYFKNDYSPVCEHGSALLDSSSFPEPAGGKYVEIEPITKPAFDAYKESEYEWVDASDVSSN